MFTVLVEFRHDKSTYAISRRYSQHIIIQVLLITATALVWVERTIPSAAFQWFPHHCFPKYKLLNVKPHNDQFLWCVWKHNCDFWTSGLPASLYVCTRPRAYFLFFYSFCFSLCSSRRLGGKPDEIKCWESSSESEKLLYNKNHLMSHWKLFAGIYNV